MARGGSTDPNGCNILLMNCNGPAESSSVSFRQIAFNRILEDVEPSIVFTQECAPGIYPYTYHDQYKQIRGNKMTTSKERKKVGFIFNRYEFKEVELPIISPEDQTDSDASESEKKKRKKFMKVLRSNVSKEIKRHQKFLTYQSYFTSKSECIDFLRLKFEERVSIALFESIRQPNFQVLAVSWHGPHSNAARGEAGFSDEDKGMLLVYMFSFVMNLHSLLENPAYKQRTVLIGGDFNLKLSKWPERVPGRYYKNMYSSKGGIRENRNQIDFFVSSTDLVVQDVGPYIMPEFYKIPEWRVLESTSPARQTVGHPIITVVERKELFDHDPIKATIYLPTYLDMGLIDAFLQMRLSA